MAATQPADAAEESSCHSRNRADAASELAGRLLKLVRPRHPADDVGGDEGVVSGIPQQRGRCLGERDERTHLGGARGSNVSLPVVRDEQNLEASGCLAMAGDPVRVDSRYSSGVLASSRHAASSVSSVEVVIRRLRRPGAESRSTVAMPQPPLTAIAVPGPTACARAPARVNPAPCRAMSPALLTDIVRANSGKGVASRSRASRPSPYTAHAPAATRSGIASQTSGSAAKAR